MGHMLLLLALLVLMDVLLMVGLMGGLHDTGGVILKPNLFAFAMFLVCVANLLIAVGIVLNTRGMT